MALIKCPECGKEISDKARVCVNCGCPISEYIEEKKEDNQKKFEYLKEQQEAEKTFSSEVRKINYVKDKPLFWKRGWFLTLICVFVPPVGVCLLWVAKKPKYASVRIALSVFLVIYAIVWCVVMFSDTDGTSTQTDSTLIEDSQQGQENEVDSNEREEGSEQEQENEAGNNEKKKDAEQEDNFLTDLGKVMDKKVAKKAYTILKKKIGFSKLEYKDQLGETTNYEIVADGYYIVLTASDDVYRIFIPNSSYVFYEDEEIKMTASDLKSKTIDQSEMYAYYSIAQEIVKNSLKNPKSADFPSIITHPEEIAMQKDADIVVVQSYVDASNSFNATIRTKWMVEFRVLDLESYLYEILYINIDGETSGEYVELD